jgi:thiol-disulfide isomerase/thioredoxin
VLLFFLGNSCPSCKAVAPTLESTFVKGYANNSSFVLLGLDAWDGDKTAVSAFKSSTSVTFPLLLEASDIASNYKVAYDRLVVVDKNGFVRFKGSQLASNDIGSAKTVVDTYLSK